MNKFKFGFYEGKEVTIDEIIDRFLYEANECRDEVVVEFEDGREFFNIDKQYQAEVYEKVAELLTELKHLYNVIPPNEMKRYMAIYHSGSEKGVGA